MAIEILMPALSPTMTEGNLAKWLKKEGDKIKPGETIAEIETDKATMEVESSDPGILGKIVVPEKTEGVKVNQLIGILLEEGEGKDAIDVILKKFQNNTPANISTPGDDKQIQKETEFKEVAKPEVQRPEHIRMSEAPISGGRIFVSPLAKRIANLERISLSNIKGSGPHGRIIKDDVLAAISNKISSTSTQYIVTRNPQEYNMKPLSQMRKVVAKRLIESKQTIPHFYLNIECCVDDLLKVREQINLSITNNNKESKNKVSVNDFIIKASGLALKSVPEANVSWSDDGIMQYNNVDISVAVALEDGLITPIIKNADQKSLLSISTEIKELVTRAKSNQLKSDEFQGGSFTISNLGMYGIKNFSAIVNPPQACIIAVGATEKRPIVKNDKVEISTIMCVTLSCDHRVVDGALGAKLLQSFKMYIENPVTMLI